MLPLRLIANAEVNELYMDGCGHIFHFATTAFYGANMNVGVDKYFVVLPLSYCQC